MLTFAIPCLFGLEGLVGDEVRRLGLKEVRVDNGRVFCQGTLADVPRLNINIRCGERVLIVLRTFAARSFEALFQGASAVAWEELVPADGQFPVKGYSLDSQLHSVPDCQKIIKRAAADRLGRAYGLGRMPETGAKYQIQFAIEAALIAKNRAPGLDRAFDAQKWTCVDSRYWLDAAGEAMDREFDGSYDIWGGDLDPKAVRIARETAVKAGVEDLVRFETADAAALRCQGEYGQVVTNPPYGERLLEKQEAEELYRMFGRVYREIPPKWRVLVITSHPEFERFFGRKADKMRKVYNGMLKCGLYQFSR